MMIIHLIHHPVSAKKFVEPLVKALNSKGIKAELWLENRRELETFISAINCPKQFAKFDISINPFKTFVRLIVLTIKFLKSKPSAIQVHQTRAALIPLFSAMIAKVPVRIYHNHGAPYLGYYGYLRVLFWLLELINCLLATHVITVSKSIRKKMVKHHIVRDYKCEVLREGSVCGIDLDEFSMDQFNRSSVLKSRKDIGIDVDAFAVLYIGRPFKRKGFHTLLNAWQQLEQTDDKNVLLIAGCTQEDVIIATGDIIKNIVALGYVTDLRSCYAACDVIVLPSFHEGLPYSLLEGAAATRPLVGSNISGIDSIIINNRNGLLLPVDNPSQLVGALIFLRDNPDARKRMGKAGREYVEQYFDREICVREMLNYYNRIGVRN